MTEDSGAESSAVETPDVEPENLGEIQAGCGDIVFMMAASVDSIQRPDLADFVQVEPRNVSASKFSFFSSHAPTRDSIVLLMGNLQEDPIYIAASVTSCNEGFWQRKRRYLVGCELTGRL